MQLRQDIGILTAPSGELSDAGRADLLYRLFITFPRESVSDVQWLRLIMNWQPFDPLKGKPLGLTVAEQARWYNLAQKLDEADEGGEREIELTIKQRDAIWNRLRSPEFKLIGPVSPQFFAFLKDFCQASGLVYDFEDDGEDDT